MKAAVLHANEDLRYEEYPTPQLRPGTVLVRVKATGICGSDIPRVLAPWRTRLSLSSAMNFPA